jgi:hypothetical protein
VIDWELFWPRYERAIFLRATCIHVIADSELTTSLWNRAQCGTTTPEAALAAAR